MRKIYFYVIETCIYGYKELARGSRKDAEGGGKGIAKCLADVIPRVPHVK